MASVRGDFVQFYDQEFHCVVRFLMRVGADKQDAENATQEAFITAWCRFAQPGNWADIARPQGWIRTVALRKYLRRPRIMLPIPDNHERPQPGSNHAELSPLTLLVVDALHGLDPETRAVMAFHIDGFTSVAIAELLGMTDQKARDLLKKGRKILRKTLADTLPGTMEEERRPVQ